MAWSDAPAAASAADPARERASLDRNVAPPHHQQPGIGKALDEMTRTERGEQAICVAAETGGWVADDRGERRDEFIVGDDR
jgi:hypothetical protein